MKSHRFVDSVTFTATAGRGGNGSFSFRREKYVPRGGPDGGDGGRGGHVILQADHDVDSLIALYYHPRQRAEEGGAGRGQQMHGRNGRDLIIRVPCGTEIRGTDTGAVLGELLEHGATLTVAEGGKGGLGNCHWKTSSHQTPLEHTNGVPGEEKKLRLDLKLIADAGLIGFPNAGKSTLLSRLTPAHPKIAPYPFTTLNPIIGTLVFDDTSRVKIVDVPGLISGAHAGAGLGHTFLRHVERTRLLLFVIDMSGADGRRPADDYRILRQELKLHRPDLAQRPRLIIANKMDLPEAQDHFREFKRQTRTKPLPVSGLTGDGLEALKQAIEELAKST